MATATLDQVLTTAVDLARAAAEEVAGRPELVGDHLGAVREDERVVTHHFVTTSPGYLGWHWAVTVARVPRGRTATVSEAQLLPGDGAVLAPAWVPWSERLQPGDLGPGDVLPFVDHDERLEQGFEATGDLDVDVMAFFELGLGRERVLSPLGRSEAADRWYRGAGGPTAPTAVSASAPCSTCGFLVLLGGSLRTEFGVCANEWAPDDGRVVSMDHGCGAHSQTDPGPVPTDWPDSAPVIDEMAMDLEISVPGEDEVSEEGTAEVVEAESLEPATAEADVVELEMAEPATAEADVVELEMAEPATGPDAEIEPTDLPPAADPAAE